MDPLTILIKKSMNLQGKAFSERSIRQMMQHGEGENPIDAISKREC